MSEQDREYFLSEIRTIAVLMVLQVIWLAVLTLTLWNLEAETKAFQAAVNERLAEHGEPPIEVKGSK